MRLRNELTSRREDAGHLTASDTSDSASERIFKEVLLMIILVEACVVSCFLAHSSGRVKEKVREGEPRVSRAVVIFLSRQLIRSS